MADLKNTEINDNLELPSGTTGERPSTPQEGQIRYNTDLETVEFWNGSNWRPLSDTHPEAEGGIVVDTDIGGVPYRIHYFTEIGTDTLTMTSPGEVEYLIVAGGGAGGSADDYSGGGGGGGAGGVLQGFTTVTPQNYSITVGVGPDGNPNDSRDAGQSGGNSSAFGQTASGGGGGGSVGVAGKSGGSGGGGARSYPAGSGTAGQGNSGGIDSEPNSGGGGGGGAGSPGFNGNNTQGGGLGGQGILSAITGKNIFYAGGGGGGTDNAGVGGQGGLGGGGRGGNNNQSGFDATANTGGGGGGAGTASALGSSQGSGSPSGDGGSGIVIVRYPRNSSLDSQPDETRPSYQPYFYARDVRSIISRTGLQLDLDAANPTSYPGNGNTWTDISNNGYTVSYSWQFNSGNFGTMDFDGNTDGFTGEWPGDEFSGPGSSRAWEAWVNPRSTSDQGIFGHKTGSGCSYYCNFGLYIYEGEYSINWYDNSTYRWLKTGVPVQTNQWAHVVGTCIEDIPKIYLNGELMATFGTTNMNYSAPNGMSIWNIAWNDKNTGKDRFNGQIGVLRFYRPGLLLPQIKQNFNALRGRYGI